MTSTTQQESLDHISDLMKDHKASNTLIKAERKRVAAEAERFGQQILAARRGLGIPDPDGKEWGDRMVKFQIGLRALAVGIQEPNFSIEGVPDSLRLWLTNPMTDSPATDEDLSMYIEMLTENEQRTAA